ncbi:MAG: beta strand repeat-containing protein, partial [Flavobacteriia bacterium]
VIVLPQPSISAQPLASQNVCINGTPTVLSVSITGGSSSFGYQWFSNTVSSNSGGTLISGAITNSYTPSSAAAGTFYYYCVITDNINGCNDPITAVSAVTVVNNILITSQPANAPPICQGGVESFSVTAAGGVAPISYQWQYYNGVSWNNVSNGLPSGAIYTGSTSTSLSVSGITSSGTHDYRVIITSPGVGCVSATSNTASLTVVNPIVITLNPVANTTICAQGSVTYTVSGTGGTPSLNYTWQYKNPSTGTWVLPTTNPPAGAVFSGQGTSSFTISGITASGTWEYRCLLSASGSGCSNATSTTAFLTVVPDPSITTQPQANSTVCLNGTLTLSTIAANGTPSLNYQWYSNTTNSNTGGNPISGATSASYSVPTGTVGTYYYYCVVSAPGNGCNDIATNVSVVTIISLTNSFTSTNVSCFGGNNGSIDLTVTGGFGYTYSWTGPGGFTSTSQDLTGLTAGTYLVTVTDANGCSTTASVTITQPAAALAASTTQTNVLCNGNTTGAIDLTVTGGTAPYSYSWSNSATSQDLSSIGAGTYTVTVTDANGCTTTASVTITQPAAALSASTTQTNVSCFGNSTGTSTVTASGGTGPYTYSWNTTPEQTTASASGLAAGTYTVTVTDANGCSTTASVTIT